jgi:hypothetical protein
MQGMNAESPTPSPTTGTSVPQASKSYSEERADPMTRVPSKLDRVFRVIIFCTGIASVLLMTWSRMSWPRCSHWDERKYLCSSLMDLGAALALCASLVGIVWTACSQYPRWGYAAIICLLFLLALVFGTAPQF